MDTSLAKNIGRAARAARAAQRKTQADVADEVGVSIEFYARIERGKTLPSVPTLVRIADVLEVTTDVLLGREPGTKVREPSGRYQVPLDAQRFGRAASKLDASNRRLLLRLTRALGKK